MPQIVEFNGQHIEFPDGMSAPDIEAAIKKNSMSLPPVKPAPEDPGVFKAGLIGAGRATDQIVKGVQQLYYGATGNKEKQDALAQEVQDNNDVYKPLADMHPIATEAGGIVPSLALTVGTGGGGLLATMGKNAVASAVPGLLGYGTTQERLGRGAAAAAGGVVGTAVGSTAARLIQPVANTAGGASKEAIDAASRLGMKPTPAQITQNPALANFENYLLRTPGSSGAMQEVVNANQTALNRAGARAMGETADDLSESTFKAANTRIGDEFTRLSQVTKPQLGNDFLTSLGHIDAANKARGPFMNKNVDSLIDKGLDLAAKGNLSGTAYKEIRTELANQAQSAFKSGDATTGQAYKAVVSALDDAAKGSLSKADQEAWDVARRQWSSFKTLSKGNVAEAGNVSAPRVASVVRANGSGLRTGAAQGEIADIARVGEAFKSVPNPNSGNLLQQALYGNPFTALPLAIGNKAMVTGYNSTLGRKYLTNGLLSSTPGAERALVQGAGLLGAPYARGLLGVE